jgi:predicted dehydrogenase
MTKAIQPLRVGIVGAGNMGEFHMKSFLKIPNVIITGIADDRPARLEQLKKEYNLPHVFTNFVDLATHPDVDAICIATPNKFHAPAAIAALEAGKHVLCEKPLARTAEEAERMVRAAIKSGTVLKTMFNWRERGDAQTLKRYIDDGGLGRVYYAKAYWMRRSGIPGMGGWFTSKELAGGGPLIDLGVHVLDMAMFLLGEPKVVAVSANVYAELGPRGRGAWTSNHWDMSDGEYEVEDLATAFIRLEGGVTLLLEASWAHYGAHGDDFGVHLHGTESGAQIDVKQYAWDDTLRIYADVAGRPAVIAPKLVEGKGHEIVIRTFCEIVRSGEWDAHKGHEGLRRAQIIDACYQSAREGREIALEDIAARL